MFRSASRSMWSRDEKNNSYYAGQNKHWSSTGVLSSSLRKKNKTRRWLKWDWERQQAGGLDIHILELWSRICCSQEVGHFNSIYIEISPGGKNTSFYEAVNLQITGLRCRFYSNSFETCTADVPHKRASAPDLVIALLAEWTRISRRQAPTFGGNPSQKSGGDVQEEHTVWAFWSGVHKHLVYTV